MSTYFLKLGANVIITSRKLDVIEATAREMEAETGGKVLALASDVRNYEQVEQVINKGYEHFGKIDILVNNAAGNFISPTERLSSRAFESVIGIVLQGTINNTLALGKRWIAENQPGTVLNIVTTYAWTGSAYVVPSATAKAGVLAMTRSLAVEWAKYKIRLNAVAPGPFPTKGAWDRLLPGDLKKSFDPAQKVPVGRNGEHQELSNLCAYLISDFSAYINGDCITIDGGEWLKGAGQFSNLEKVTPEMWDMLEQLTRGAK
jgi:NAD(P)-dependent dehydrogenase (short-subunit alcohol dehydrogenase family)